MGQLVAGVVTVTSVDGRQVARTKAGGKVGYTVSDLRPGTYILIVTARGFRPEAARATGRLTPSSRRQTASPVSAAVNLMLR